MSVRNPNGFDPLDNHLRGLFTRAANHIEPQSDLAESVQRRLEQGDRSTPTGVAQRRPAVAATLSAFLVVALLAGVFFAFGRGGLRPSGTGGTGGSPAATSTTATTPLRVTSVDLAVSPQSIAGEACGANVTFTYTATFHLPAQSAGGVIQFAYTLNNGRSQTTDSVQAPAGATSVTATFTSSGALPVDHTYPEPAIVMVTSPNQIMSPSVTPNGSCG